MQCCIFGYVCCCFIQLGIFLIICLHAKNFLSILVALLIYEVLTYNSFVILDPQKLTVCMGCL